MAPRRWPWRARLPLAVTLLAPPIACGLCLAGRGGAPRAIQRTPAGAGCATGRQLLQTVARRERAVDAPEPPAADEQRPRPRWARWTRRRLRGGRPDARPVDTPEAQASEPPALPARGGEALPSDHRLLERQQEAQAHSLLEQLLGLEGGLRRNVLLLALWLAGGSLFYYLDGFEELSSTSAVASFYYAVQAGLSIGFGVLTPRSEESMLFTIMFLITGAAVCAEFLSTFVTDTISKLESGRLGIVIKDPRESSNRYVLVLLGWWALGASFGHFHEGWSWTRSLFFAVSATSTAGMQGLASTDEASLLFCSVYCLLGVPLYAATIGSVSFSIAERVMQKRRAQIRERAVQLMEVCEEECTLEIFDIHDSSGTGHLNRQDLQTLIKFLANARGMVVTEEDMAFVLSEFDKDGDNAISREEFIEGINRWIQEDREHKADGNAPR